MMKGRRLFAEKPCFIGVALAGLVFGSLLIASFVRSSDNNLLCNLTYNEKERVVSGGYDPTPIQLRAILHYATTPVTPQQNFKEISISFNILNKLAPCNFLVFGLGHDSLMWSSFNPRGTTLFLEEDPDWVKTVLKDAPDLRARTVQYKTQLQQADQLITHYRSEPACAPDGAYLKGNTRCRLALSNLPEEVYEREWDLIMIDAPRGWFAEAPGRMGAIFSAAVMARNRKGSGVTHVFLHDINRRVEKLYGEEFLCRKYLVNSSGRLWHFEIPPAGNATADGYRFC